MTSKTKPRPVGVSAGTDMRYSPCLIEVPLEKPYPKMPTIIDLAGLSSFMYRRLHKVCYWLVNPDQQYRDIKLPKNPKTEWDEETKTMKKIARFRHISMPAVGIKRLQQQLMHNIFAKYPLPDYITGFVPGLNGVVESSKKHSNKEVVISMDIQDYFTSIKASKVRYLLGKFGYSFPVANAITQLITRRNKLEYSYKDKRTGKIISGTKSVISLPQGSPTSPIVANVVSAETIGPPLAEIAEKYKFDFTLYADDVTLSSRPDSPSTSKETCYEIIEKCTQVVRSFGLRINYNKTQVMSKNTRQYVLGITVNDGIHVPKKYAKFKAVLHNIMKNGVLPECAEWMNREIQELKSTSSSDDQLHSKLVRKGFIKLGGQVIYQATIDDQSTLKVGSFLSWLSGNIAWISSVDPRKGEKLRRDLDLINTVHKDEKYLPYQEQGLSYLPESSSAHECDLQELSKSK